MFKLMGNKIITILHLKNLLNWPCFIETKHMFIFVRKEIVTLKNFLTQHDDKVRL